MSPYPPRGVPISFTPPREILGAAIPPAESPPAKKVECRHDNVIFAPDLVECPSCGGVWVRA